jgi:hypothetical protein
VCFSHCAAASVLLLPTGRKRPPGWPAGTYLPPSQKGVSWALPGGLASIRSGLAAAGIHSLPQLQQLVAAELARHHAIVAAADGFALAAAGGLGAAQQQQQQQKTRKALSQAFKQARREHGSARLEEHAKRLWGQVMCSSQCGQIAAKWCSQQCCGDCCRKAAAAAGADAVLCVRHKINTPAVDEAAAAEDGADADGVEDE